MQPLKWLPLVLISIACGSSVEESGDTDSSSSSGDPQTSSPSTTVGATTSPSTTSPSTTATASDTDTASSEGSDSGSGSSSDDTTGALDSSSSDDGTTGEPPARTCLGITQYGSLGNVLGREGGEPPEPDCDATPAPCGGDLVGTWIPAVTCGYEAVHNPFAASCPGSVLTVTSVEQTGTLEFVDDGTFLQEYETTQNYTLSMDAETCFAIGCDALEAVLDETSEASCSGPDDACECEVVDFDDDGVGGTYEIVGDTLVLTVSGQAALPYPYCVTDDRLDMWSPLTDAIGTGAVCDVVDDCEAALGDMYDAYACVDVTED